MNTENSKTNESHRFRLTLADKPNLKGPNINMALTNYAFIIHGKIINLHIPTINLKFCARK